jgi:hypothetical protein
VQMLLAKSYNECDNVGHLFPSHHYERECSLVFILEKEEKRERGSERKVKEEEEEEAIAEKKLKKDILYY